MKENTFNYILEVIRNNMNEEAVPPTNMASSGNVSGLSGKEGDLPPVDLRKKKFKNWNPFFKKLLNIQRRSSKIRK